MSEHCELHFPVIAWKFIAVKHSAGNCLGLTQKPSPPAPHSLQASWALMQPRRGIGL